MYHDLTLRDGSHAIKHKLSAETIERYCKFAESVGIEVIEVGHGNGLGASSILIGESLLSDSEMLRVAKKNLKNTKLSVHIIPGIATVSRDVDQAISIGVDIFRIACHCTEATVTKTHIEYLSSKGKTVLGVLMMAALCSIDTLVEEALKMKSYGVSGIIVMDSTGSFVPSDVSVRISRLVKEVCLPIGFHGHNNMHLAVANSLSAIEAGASIIDVTFRGFGAGAGNTPFEVMANLAPQKSLDVEKVLDFCEKFEFSAPECKPVNLLTAKYKLFSGFEKHILEASKTYGVSIHRLTRELGERKLVAGQEDLVRVIAQSLETFQK